MPPVRSLQSDAFAPLYHHYNRLVASIAAHFPLSPQQQEEVCQEVFLIIWEKKEQLVHEQALASWIGTVTRHRCLSELRRMRPMVALEDLSEEVLHARPENRQLSSWESKSWHLELSLRLLQQLIDSHRSPIRRRVAQLYYRDGRSVAAVASDLGLCPNTVLSHLRRFRLVVEKSLVRLLEEQGIDLVSA
jgi:RNA polymerase sigma-70 factor (ECF subfamily)